MNDSFALISDYYEGPNKTNLMKYSEYRENDIKCFNNIVPIINT